MNIRTIRRLSAMLKYVSQTNQKVLFITDGCQLVITKRNLDQTEGEVYNQVSCDEYSEIAAISGESIQKLLARIQLPNHKIEQTNGDIPKH